MNLKSPLACRGALLCVSICICSATGGPAVGQTDQGSTARGVYMLEPPASPSGAPASPSGANGVPQPALQPAPSASPPPTSGEAPLLVPAPAIASPSGGSSGSGGSLQGPSASDAGSAPGPTTPKVSAPASRPSSAANAPGELFRPGGAGSAGTSPVAPPAGTAEVGAAENELSMEALSSAVKVPDQAGLSLQIVPGPVVAAGSPVSFQISTKRAGYLILVDVNAAGKAVQIYPNPMSLMEPGEVREKANFIRPGKIVRLPDRGDPYSGFEFVASPPRGAAMVVALLSERPVQLLDLPELSAPGEGKAATVEAFVRFAEDLRVPSNGSDAALEDAHWSFAVTAYAVR